VRQFNLDTENGMKARLQSLLKQTQAAIDEVDQESQAWRAQNMGKFDFGLVATIFIACTCIATIEYFGGSSDYKILKPIVALFVETPEKWLAEAFRNGQRLTQQEMLGENIN
jgi:hypothetical protein